MFDANNMPILCQFVSSKYRATAYGIMNMVGVMAGAYITKILGQSADALCNRLLRAQSTAQPDPESRCDHCYPEVVV